VNVEKKQKFKTACPVLRGRKAKATLRGKIFAEKSSDFVQDRQQIKSTQISLSSYYQILSTNQRKEIEKDEIQQAG